MTSQTSTEFYLGSSCEGTTLNSSDQNPWDDSDLVTISSAENIIAQIRMYSQLVIIPIELILKLFRFIVFIKSKIAQTVTGIHLTFLAIADNLVPFTMFVFASDDWSRHMAIPGLRNGILFYL